MIGQTISHYTILEKLGEGGMGVVYKAQDSTLDRIVALKFLPAHVSINDETKARFLQEAKAAAALNHPHICTIHGVEEDGSQMFIVMEYIEGGTLRTKIPFARAEEAVAIAAQIGEALQEAHAKGIVHRDIKADNIMLTLKGQVKVMDFGLAKLRGSVKLTRTSSTVGTLAYMAPEQIQGGEVDHRSDIFSFGVLLYEMLTGELPFRGEHEAAMVYSIVNEEPRSITSLLPDISPIVANLIQRCLEKDPDDRYQHCDDIVADLKRSQKKTSKVMRSSAHIPTVPTAPLPSSPGTPAPQESPAPRIRTSASIIVGSIAAIAAIALAIWYFLGPSLPKINPNMSVTTLLIPAREYQYPGISPDGKWLTFPGADLNGKWDIYMMFIQTGESKRVTNDSSLTLGNAATAKFSPDGSSIAYARCRRGADPSQGVVAAEVCVVSTLSGQVRVVADSGIAPLWSPDGRRIFYYRSKQTPKRTELHEYWSVTPQGTDARIEFVDSLVAGSLTYFTLGISPDGKKFLFTRPMEGNYNEIFIHDLATGAETRLTDDKKTIDEVLWLANGYILYSSNRSGNFNIWAIPEDGGRATQITRGAGPDYGISVSLATNRMVFSQRSDVATLWMVNTDGTGSRQVYPEENITGSALSPDGTTLALEISHPVLNNTLMVRDLNGAHQEMLFPHDSAIARYLPRWSPSGRLLSFLEIGADGLGSGRILQFAGSRHTQDLGHEVLFAWLSDSTAFVAKDTTLSPGVPKFNVPRLRNIRTGNETVPPNNQYLPYPVLGNTMILLLGQRGGAARLLSRQEFDHNPHAEGKSLITESSWTAPGAGWLYYATTNQDAVWKINLQTLKKSKIVDLPPGNRYTFGELDYSGKVITYSQRHQKTNIVKIDDLFVK